MYRREVSVEPMSNFLIKSDNQAHNIVQLNWVNNRDKTLQQDIP